MLDRRRVSLRRCGIGVGADRAPGWLVLFGGKLVAVLQKFEDDDEVFLAAGLEDPFVCVMQSWDNLAEAKAYFLNVGRLYRAGIPPQDIAHAFDSARRQETSATHPGPDRV